MLPRWTKGCNPIWGFYLIRISILFLRRSKMRIGSDLENLIRRLRRKKQESRKINGLISSPKYLRTSEGPPRRSPRSRSRWGGRRRARQKGRSPQQASGNHRSCSEREYRYIALPPDHQSDKGFLPLPLYGSS